MELKLDPDQYEKQQALLMGEMIEKISIKLLEAGIEGEKLQELTASLAFSIASVIDDTAGIEVNGMEVHPYLGFRVAEEIIHCGENSYTYEHVYDLLNQRFNS